MKTQLPSSENTITVHVPMEFTNRGGRKTVISEKTLPPPQPRIDNALLKALARAHRWRQLVEDGTFASVTELAKAEGVNESYACRMFRLTLLAPAIVTAILDGEHTSHLMLKTILRPLPVQWDGQIAVLQMRASQHKLNSFSRNATESG